MGAGGRWAAATTWAAAAGLLLLLSMLALLALLLAPPTGTVQENGVDGELENCFRIPSASLDMEPTVDVRPQTLVLRAVPSSATGETVGETGLFATQADWLKTTKTFDATLKIRVAGTRLAAELR